MSTLKVTDIQSNGTGFNDVVSFQNASGTENGTLCRAWVNFDGTTGSGVGFSDITIRGSFNVSSITDNGTGQYTATLTNSMADTNGSVSCSAFNASTVPVQHAAQIISSSQISIRTRDNNSVNSDMDGTNVQLFR